MIVITLQDIFGLIILGLMIILFIVFLIVSVIKAWLDSIFKKNCYDCKHYEFYDTCGSGNYCKYKCNKKDRVDDEDMNSSIHYEKCDDFEKKEKE